MSFIKDLLASWKVRIGFVGGAIVIATTYGTCTIDPNEEAIKEEVLKEEEKSEEKPEEKSEEKPEEKSEEKSEEKPEEKSEEK